MCVNVVITIFKLVIAQTDRWDNFSKALPCCSFLLASAYRAEVGIPGHSQVGILWAPNTRATLGSLGKDGLEPPKRRDAPEKPCGTERSLINAEARRAGSSQEPTCTGKALDVNPLSPVSTYMWIPVAGIRPGQGSVTGSWETQGDFPWLGGWESWNITGIGFKKGNFSNCKTKIIRASIC